MNAKKRLILLVALVAIFAVISVSLANDTVEGRTRNRITTGKVEISVNESTTAVNGTISENGIDFTDVLPGNTVSKVVTIQNQAEKCWLRVKVEVTVDPKPADGSDPSALIVPNIDKTHWELKDGYYYYTSPLEKDDVAAMFDKVVFAPTIGNAYAGSQAKMVITAEATQYKNNETMSPDSWPSDEGGGNG